MSVQNPLVRGLAAGFAGTVALTASQRIEMRVTGRPASDIPAQVAEGILRVPAQGRRTRAVMAFGTHWFNNTSCGVFAPAADAVGLSGTAAAGLTFALYVAGSTAMFTRLGLAPPLFKSPRQAALEVIHASVYAVAATTAYALLTPEEDRSGETFSVS